MPLDSSTQPSPHLSPQITEVPDVTSSATSEEISRPQSAQETSYPIYSNRSSPLQPFPELDLDLDLELELADFSPIFFAQKTKSGACPEESAMSKPAIDGKNHGSPKGPTLAQVLWSHEKEVTEGNGQGGMSDTEPSEENAVTVQNAPEDTSEKTRE